MILGNRFYEPVSWRAAAPLHSIVRWKPLDVWNAGLGWRATAALVGIHGRRLVMPAKERMAVTDDITTERLMRWKRSPHVWTPYLKSVPA